MKDELEDSTRSSSSGHGGSGSPNPARRSMESLGHSNSAPGGRSPLHPRGGGGSGAKGTTPARKSHSRFVDPPERVAAPLPRFGQWDVNNPSSADEFSAIFEDAVVEKRGDLVRGGGIAYSYGSDRDRSSSSFDRKKPKSITERLCCCFMPKLG